MSTIQNRLKGKSLYTVIYSVYVSEQKCQMNCRQRNFDFSDKLIKGNSHIQPQAFSYLYI